VLLVLALWLVVEAWRSLRRPTGANPVPMAEAA